ncbi:MAG: Intracellular exo-alpha-(1-_5)-L-arabinofuranosidase [candidate division BRC1 bacterium ADurb.BinA364]|nr:MAG: Intracellular exo-alpha-(1->5)-L-arabinofuranosidase [candidate division BRC1 bacterium ADurb.BinA364]
MGFTEWRFACLALLGWARFGLAADAPADDEDRNIGAPAIVSVSAAAPGHEISRMLTGFNVLFCWQTRDLWADGRAAQWLKSAGTGLLRYPGGEVTDYFHWETPYYPGWKDAWETDPAHRHYFDPAEARKNIGTYLAPEDFIALCREIGAQPMLGANLESGLAYGRLDDSIAEAVRWARHARELGWGVKYWFIGNETYHHGAHVRATSAEYGEYVRRFGEALKAADPGIRIVANWQANSFNAGTMAQWRTIVETAGEFIDVADVHWYWNWGKVRFSNWLEQNPIGRRNQWYQGGSFVEEIAKFREEMKKLGRSDIELAALEWNVGPTEFEPLSAFQCMLIQAEHLQQFIEGGLDMACFWPMSFDPARAAETNDFHAREFIYRDEQGRYQPRPALEAFRLYAPALGTRFVAAKSSIAALPSIAALDEAGGVLRLYAINKSMLPRTARFEIEGFAASKAAARAIVSENPNSNECQVRPLEAQLESAAVSIDLPALSVATIELN